MRNGVAIGLAILIASVAGFSLYESASWKQHQYEHSARYRTDQYADRAKAIIKKTCRVLPSDKKAACVAEAEETADQAYRDEYGLEAQRVTATWTAKMGIVAIIGMMASLIGIVLVFITFRETRRTADAAFTSIEMQIQIERGYVSCPWGAFILKGNELVAELSAGGGGKGEAFIQSLKWSVMNESKFPRRFENFMSISKVLPYNMSMPIIDVPVDKNTFKEGMFFGGLIEYTSMGKAFKTYFCLKALPSPHAQTNPSCLFIVQDAKGEDWPLNT